MPLANNPQPSPPAVRLFFFWSGILATILYRLIIVLEHVEGPWVKIAWYGGTVGFIFYFLHRYRVTQRRARLIADRQLSEKVETSSLEPDDKAALRYVLGTIRTSKERWNYITIFVTSALALIAGALLDLIG